ncbi:hypothetical protein [Algirhabdus cladophorae]|uniref:hypothetical protein n=1 Tax=Algirhabdus cladophorae TaxID=3377108 RepID=UPI003B845F85
MILNKYENTAKNIMMVVYDDTGGTLPYAGTDARADFLGAVENKITQVTCGRR